LSAIFANHLALAQKTTRLKKLLAEFAGTFIMVFLGTGAIVLDDVTGGSVTHAGVSVAFGLSVTLMILAFGHVSGAHINPAVTVTLWAAGRFPGQKVLRFIMAQSAGALLASFLLHRLYPSQPTLGATLPSGSPLASFLLEIVLTYLLLLVIFTVTTGPRHLGILPALIIGATVGLEAYFCGPVSGASMNPARSLGPALVSGQLSSLWIYLSAPLIGGLLAVPACRRIRGRACCPSPSSCRPSAT
jgi:aquaporin NIP